MESASEQRQLTMSVNQFLQKKRVPVFARSHSMRLLCVPESEKWIEENTFSICERRERKNDRAVEKGNK